MGRTSEKREFSRFSVGFELAISSKDPQGRKFRDRAVLKDISGGGAKFTTLMGNSYFSGQILELIIQLPSTGEDTSAFLRGNATVIWVKKKKELQDPKTRRYRTEIAVKLESHLDFGRI
jgi:c-di-GMP-binding flagellar brake protein YcgR